MNVAYFSPIAATAQTRLGGYVFIKAFLGSVHSCTVFMSLA